MKFLYCILYLIVSGIVIFLIGRIFPRKWIKYNKFPFKSFKLENNGIIYNKLKIKKWKTKLPDASVIICKFIPKFMPIKRIKTNKKEEIEVLVKETCVAESTHFIAALTGFFCVRIWKSLGGWIISFIYLIWNYLFIMIQRYNRPRLINTIKRIEAI